MTWIAVGVGGALGSLARHAVNQVVHRWWLTTSFPVGTLVVNLVGCFVIGLLAGLLAAERLVVGLYWREFVVVGLLGGFTTFSAFGLDTFVLARTPTAVAAIINVFAHVAGGLTALAIGYWLGKQ
jgi:CrcB protein